MDPGISTDPAEIILREGHRELLIRWTDGHQSRYPFDLLRRECPCAVCHEARRKQDPLRVITGPIVKPGEVQVVDYRPVGRYALSFTWSDGHATGIYSFDFLRALCPCETCTTGS